jgi:hypothetical protein
MPNTTPGYETCRTGFPLETDQMVALRTAVDQLEQTAQTLERHVTSNISNKIKELQKDLEMLHSSALTPPAP